MVDISSIVRNVLNRNDVSGMAVVLEPPINCDVKIADDHIEIIPESILIGLDDIDAVELKKAGVITLRLRSPLRPLTLYIYD